jgi:hypothetical protein
VWWEERQEVGGALEKWTRGRACGVRGEKRAVGAKRGGGARGIDDTDVNEIDGGAVVEEVVTNGGVLR